MNLKLLLIPIVVLAGLLGVATSASGADQPAQTYTVNVGGGITGIAANDFFPDAITIHKGDTIHFVAPAAEIHTVTYLPPTDAVPDLLIPAPNGLGQVFNPIATTPTNTTAGPAVFDSNALFNSGLVAGGATADVTFNDATNGSDIRFVCLVHPNMDLHVSVVSPAASVPTQDQIDAAAAAQRDAVIATGESVAASVQPAATTDASGVTTTNLQIGGGAGDADVMQFLPSGPTTIKVGDVVKWTNNEDTPHTVTFLSGTPMPDLTQQQGAYLGFNVQAVLPAGGSSYDGSGFTNSGLMDRSGQTPGGSSYSLTFTKPGTFTYLCLLHADQGMTGTIVVKAAQPAAPPPVTKPIGNIGPPDTGSGPSPHAHGSLLIATLLAAAIGGALVAAGRFSVGRGR